MLAWVLIAALCGAGSAEGAPRPPLTLESALAEAARNNLDLAVARTAQRRSEAGVLAGYQGFLPRLDISATFGRDYQGAQRVILPSLQSIDLTTTPPTLEYTNEPVETPASSFPDYAIKATVEERLFDGLRSWAALNQAKAQERAARLQIDESALSVAFLVAQRFYEVVKAEQSLQVLEETAAQSRELVARADALFAAGRIPRGDTLTARVNLDNDLINLEAQKARLEQARSDLAVALGRQADPALAVEIPAELQAAAFARERYEPPALEVLVARARERRPARTREIELARAAELGISAARADYFPAVGLSFAYERQSPELTGITGVYGRLERQYVATAKVAVQWNLFNGLGTRAAEDTARADAERARLSRAQIEQQIGNEVAHARANVVSLGRAARLAEESLASAETAVKLMRERFDAGAATELEVRDAQLKLTQARLTIVSTRSDCAVAFADLNRAVGGGL